MKIYHHIDEFVSAKNAVVTIGTFDGVHLGHRKIIERIKQLAKASGGETVILTFFPHPRMILHPEDQGLKMINTMDEKAQLLERLCVDHLIITPFSRDFSNQTAESYIRDVLVNKIGTKKIVIGYDHRFGKDRQGGLAELQKFAPVYDYEVIEIPEQDINDVAISSTRIREALLHDSINLANEFLGYHFFITGKVIKGDQIGRQIGFPTANLAIDEKYKLIPGDGIFAAKVYIDGQPYTGMAYIGSRPTISGMTRNIEVNIFDFNSDIKFVSLEELTRQLALDKESTLALMA